VIQRLPPRQSGWIDANPPCRFALHQTERRPVAHEPLGPVGSADRGCIPS
jgi:hypothetical protein